MIVRVWPDGSARDTRIILVQGACPTSSSWLARVFPLKLVVGVTRRWEREQIPSPRRWKKERMCGSNARALDAPRRGRPPPFIVQGGG